jgi:hypothetical protein
LGIIDWLLQGGPWTAEVDYRGNTVKSRHKQLYCECCNIAYTDEFACAKYFLFRDFTVV